MVALGAGGRMESRLRGNDSWGPTLHSILGSEGWPREGTEYLPVGSVIILMRFKGPDSREARSFL
jgi:hypothetical protein